jgi:hypothetical protein
MTEPRKATEVLSELESKVDALLGVVRAQNLNINVLSNKLSQLLETLNTLPSKQETLIPRPTVEASGYQMASANGKGTASVSPSQVYNPHGISLPPDLTMPETNLTLETNPKGFTRNSRPETFSPEHRFPERQKPKVEEAVVQLPPQSATTPNTSVKFTPPTNTLPSPELTNSKIPVIQRVVDKNNKAIFLADIEVYNEMNILESKTRTGPSGKWQASLKPGRYHVLVKKSQNSLKDKLEIKQQISVDGRSVPQEIETLIVK